MNPKNWIKNGIALIVIGTLVFTSCKKSTITVDISRDVDNDHLIQWDNSLPVGNYVLTLEDLSSGILSEVGNAREEYEDVEVTSITVASFSLITSDVSSFDYLDSLKVYLNESNPTADLPENPSPNGAYLGMMRVSENNNASINLELTEVELKSFFEDNDQYDLYFEGKINNKLGNYSQNRIVDVELTFRVSMEG